MTFKTLKEVRTLIEGVDDRAEAIKQAARMLAPAEAFCEYYRHALRDQIIAEESNKGVVHMGGERIIEKRLERIARDSTAYKKAAIMYRDAMEVRVYLRTYIAGLKMEHEAKLQKDRRETAEIRQNIYHTGS